MQTSTQQAVSTRNMRSTGFAILWSLIWMGSAGALVGIVMSFVQPLLSSTQQMDFGQAIVASIQGALILFWYLVPLGLVVGILVGILLGFTYPLTLKLSGRERPPALYATLLGIVIFVLSFYQVNSVSLFLYQAVAPYGWLLPSLLGLTSAVVGFFIARLTIYRPRARSAAQEG